jgi:hypothetical protein
MCGAVPSLPRAFHVVQRDLSLLVQDRVDCRVAVTSYTSRNGEK